MTLGSVSRPDPLTKFTTPFGRHFCRASMVKTCAKAPIAGSLRMTGFPISNAGIIIAYISFSG